MLSVSSKSAKRISSLFSLGSKDSAPPESEHHRHDSSSKSSNRSASVGSSHQASELLPPPLPSHALRHSVSAQHLNTSSNVSISSRIVSAPLPADPSAHLAPPPSLGSINPSLSDGSSERHGRHRSFSGSISGVTSGFARPRSSSQVRAGQESRLMKGMSWLPGKSRTSSTDATFSPISRAWIAGTGQEIPYDANPLTAGERVSELWDEQGDTYVYLFPQNTGRQPSFKIDSSVFASSPSLTFLARGSDPLAQTQTRLRQEPPPQLTLPESISPSTSALTGSNEEDDELESTGTRAFGESLADEVPQELHLYVPVPLDSDVSPTSCVLTDDDVDMLILFRNMFAFLVGQSLIATPRFPSIFSIFIEVSGLLGRFEFSNLDGSSFGEVATTSFACYCDELNLTDIRKSRDRTLQAIVLGERMRFLPLYNEGFVHAVGKLDDIKSLNSSKFDLISSTTQNRLERAYIDLDTRLRTVRTKLDDFDFPSIFAGIANSNVANEAKGVRFKDWKGAYMAYRKNVMSYYRSRFGSWPPKAKSKKHDFEESGLNRLVLKELYQDFADLYDMLVDRTSLTTRTTDMPASDLDGEPTDPTEFVQRALRQIMSEYDRSTPPVAPPIPFDTPLLPSILSIRRKLDPNNQAKVAKERAKKLTSAEINEILVGSYNHTSMKPTPFLEDFMNFERRAASGKTTDELIDYRCGQWLFMYSVIQSLPMLVVDSPDLKVSDGVEYFLCIPPRGGAPWSRDDTKAGRSWFGVAGGSGVVNLPSDIIANGVEGIYRRSHCWQMASRWADQPQILASVVPGESPRIQYPNSPIGPPPAPPLSSAGSSSDRQVTPLLTPGSYTPPLISLPLPRESSPAFMRPGNRSSIHIGLEALPLPAGVMPMEPPARPVSSNPNMSFDDILRAVPNKKGKK
ncbi:hypothetical protein AJ80_00151 [Polytolypa hystricis UAMH7299]|uniref:DUF8004 domain-containing protein n=1 Tax=Polytolypa hystricis (strain UAMH7299) TaxID=1447883 RepID=A0A2B7Z4C8_POLH7|nr:hypothetical protein AJ80_00151 [Polytolypa hystricis UAMH7299]